MLFLAGGNLHPLSMQRPLRSIGRHLGSPPSSEASGGFFLFFFDEAALYHFRAASGKKFLIGERNSRGSRSHEAPTNTRAPHRQPENVLMNNAESESLCVTPPFFSPPFFYRILIRLTAGIPEHSVAHENPRPNPPFPPCTAETGVVCVKPTSLRFFFFGENAATLCG